MTTRTIAIVLLSMMALRGFVSILVGAQRIPKKGGQFGPTDVYAGLVSLAVAVYFLLVVL